jgi:hypothetical protein
MRTGAIAAGQTTAVVEVTQWPGTLTLKSDAVTRKIELSTDGGTEYFQPSTDSSSTTSTQLVVTISGPVTHVKFTGEADDVWVVL